MTNLTPSPFGTPGGPMDTLTAADPDQEFPPDETPRAENFNLAGRATLAAQARILALENQLRISRQMALLFTTGWADYVEGPAGLAQIIATSGLDIRMRFTHSAGQQPSVFIGTAATPGSCAFVLTQGPAGWLYPTLMPASGTGSQPAVATNLALVWDDPSSVAAPIGLIGPWMTFRFTWHAATGAAASFGSGDRGTTWTQIATGSAPMALANNPAWSVRIGNVGLNGRCAVAWVDIRTFDGMQLAFFDATKPWVGNTWTDPQGKVWSFVGIGGAWFNQSVPSHISQRIEFTTSGAVTVPLWAQWADLYAIGAGAGGGGGGSASTIANQAGGGGGGSSLPVQVSVPVTPGQTMSASVGAPGLGGAGGAAGGNVGGGGSHGGACHITVPGVSLATAMQSGAASSSAANSPIAGIGGGVNATWTPSPILFPNGVGLFGLGGSGHGTYWNGSSAGGAGGGPANATNGGGGGTAATSPVVSTYLAPGAVGASTTANGVDGNNAAWFGSGGGGGGGGAPGGAGGRGGNGGPARAIITFYGVA